MLGGGGHAIAHDANRLEVGVGRNRRGMNGVVADAGHGGRNVDILQPLTIAEAGGADALQSFGQPDIAQSAAVVESVVADRCHIVGDVYGLQ